MPVLGQTILSPAQIIEAAKLAGGYAIIDKETRGAFFGGVVQNLIAEKIFFVWKRVEYRYIKDPTDSTLRSTANFLWDLCGKYGLRALSTLQVGGVVVNPTPNVANFLVKQRSYPQFIVGAVDSPMSEGDTVLEIFDDFIVQESRDGEVEVHVDGGELGQTLLDRTSYTPVYTTGKYTITFTDPQRDGTLIMVDYPVRVNLVFTDTEAVLADDLYVAVLVDFEIKTLLNSAGNIYPIPAGTQGKLKIELAGVSTLGENVYGNWNYYVNNIGGTITLSLSDGGIIYDTFVPSMYDNILIQANDALGGVEIVGTGRDGSTITLSATFNYEPFGL